MLLTEQKIKRIGRRFWRGSQFKDWEKSKSIYNCLYITGDIFYAITYLKPGDFDFRDTGYLFEYWLKERINIFNPRYQKDYQKLEDYCRVHCKRFLAILPKLKDYDWLDVLSFNSREHLIGILKILGYEGFFNVENKQGKILRNLPFVVNESDLYGFSGLGIFNEDCLTLHKAYRGWSEISKLQEVKPLIEEAKAECAEKALFAYNKVPHLQSELDKKGPNKIKDDLAEKIIAESFLPYFLMLDEEIYEFVYNFDFKKKLREERLLRKKLTESGRPFFNVPRSL